MPKACTMLSAQEKERNLKVAQQMFSQKKDFVGEKVAFGLVGQIVRWNDERNFGFIRTRDMSAADDGYFCHGSAFLNQCGKNDIVKFDVWENYQKQSQKAVNVCFLQRGTSVSTDKIATDKIGTMSKWFGSSQKGKITGSDGKEYSCTAEDFEHGDFPYGSRVCFDIIKDNIKDNFTSTEKVVCRAVNIRNAKIVRHKHLDGVEGRVLKMVHPYQGRSGYGFVSTTRCDQDIYFNGTELTRLRMQDARYNDRITFDVIMEEDGSLTAENINMHIATAKTRHLIAEAKQLVADFSSGKCKKMLSADETIKKVSAVAADDDCASTTASELPEAAPEVPEPAAEVTIDAELRKLSKKLREIRGLEGRPNLDPLQQAKVAKKREYQQLLEKLTP